MTGRRCPPVGQRGPRRGRWEEAAREGGPPRKEWPSRRMAPRKKTTHEEPPPAGGEAAGGEEGRGDAAGLKAAVVEQLRAKLTQTLDLQALRPTLAAAVAQKLMSEGFASKLSVQSLADSVASALARELTQEDCAFRAMVAAELATKLAGG